MFKEATHGINKINFRTVLQFQMDVYDKASGCEEIGLFGAFCNHRNVTHTTALAKCSYPLLFVKQNSFLSGQNFKITLTPN